MRGLSLVVLFACLSTLPGQAQSLPSPIGNYQAYAVNPSSGAYGFAYGYDDRNAAIRDARNGCGGSACRIVHTAQGRCSALFVVTTNSGRRYGAHWGNTIGDAERLAAQSCTSLTGRTCRKLHSGCAD